VSALKRQMANVPVAKEPGEAQKQPAFTSAEQDQILNLVIRLLRTVDQSHGKKFYKHYVANYFQGGLISTCSHGGWKGGGFGIDDALLTRLWKAQAQVGCPLPSDGAAGPALAPRR
jgi:hypothetical protein